MAKPKTEGAVLLELKESNPAEYDRVMVLSGPEYRAAITALMVPDQSIGATAMTMFAFAFDIYLDAAHVTNVVIHAADRVSAWAALADYTAGHGIEYDAVQLAGSRAITA